MASTSSSNTIPLPQTMLPDELSVLVRRLADHPDGIRNRAARLMAEHPRLAAGAIAHLTGTPINRVADNTASDDAAKPSVPVRDVMLAEIGKLESTLADAGFAPRRGEG